MSEEYKPLEVALFEAIKVFSVRNDLWFSSLQDNGGTFTMNIPDEEGNTAIPLKITLNKLGRIKEPIVIDCPEETPTELCQKFQAYLKSEYGIDCIYEPN